MIHMYLTLLSLIMSTLGTRMSFRASSTTPKMSLLSTRVMRAKPASRDTKTSHRELSASVHVRNMAVYAPLFGEAVGIARPEFGHVFDHDRLERPASTRRHNGKVEEHVTQLGLDLFEVELMTLL